jgi:integrase/recombinase XerD
MLLSEARERFLTWARSERNLSSPTLRAYGGDLKLLIRELGDRPVVEVSGDRLREYFASLSAAQNYADTTIRRRIASAKVFFGFLELERETALSPARSLRGRYTIAKRLPKVMTPREVRSFLHGIRRSQAQHFVGVEVAHSTTSLAPAYRYLRDVSLFETLFLTGLRVGELVGLDCSDLNLSDGSIRVLGKGRRERIAFLSNPEVLEVVKAYVHIRSRLPCETTALYLNSRLERMSIYSVEFLFGKYCRAARIKRHYTPHCLRHTMATMLLNNGADIRVVQELLGHRTIVTTQIYTEVSSVQKRKALARFSGRNSIDLGPLDMSLIASGLVRA